MSTYTPGPGDEVTWPACAGHPNDPRTEVSDDEAGLRYLIEHAQELIGRAERALDAGEIQIAIDYLNSAGSDLSGADWS
jgi:hypothetical protein